MRHIGELDAAVAILIGGDTPTRAMLRFLLEEDSCHVLEVGDVDAAVALPQAEDAVLFVVIAADGGQDIGSHVGRLRHCGFAASIMAVGRSVNLDVRRHLFALGAQEVVGLPIGAHDLQLRLRATLGARRSPVAPKVDAGVVRAGGLVLRSDETRIGNDGGWSVELTRREVALLKRLMSSPGQVVTHRDLLDGVWPEGAPGTSNALAVLVRRLRAKLGRPGAPHGYIQTAHGQGYTFDARAVPRPAKGTAGPSGLQVLVVEDDPATVQMITDVLSVAGYSVMSITGAQTPTVVRQIQPRVILLDINMPGMDGIEVRRHLRSTPHTAAIPVIALSAGRNLRQRAGEMGADDYLAKPFSTDELLLRIARWIGSAPRA